MRRLLTVSLLTLAALTSAARADRRSLAQTYEYATMPKGGLELELHNIQVKPELGEDPMGFELQLEVEYGITDHWDIAFYQVMAQGPEDGASLQYVETKLESRFRFSERGELPVDPLLYFEIAKSLVGDEMELEAKIILARDFGPLTVAVNLIAELLIEGDEVTFIPAWAAGLTYEITPSWKLGAESFGEYEEASGDEPRELVAWLGPTISWAPDPKLWITANVGFGLTEDSDDLVARIVLGLGL